MSKANVVYSYFYRYFILLFVITASNYLILNINLSIIREFKHLFYILSGILIRSYPKIIR